MAIIDGLLQELEQEAKTTRHVLERVPDNHLRWTPHPKARNAGRPCAPYRDHSGLLCRACCLAISGGSSALYQPEPEERLGTHCDPRRERREGEEGTPGDG